MKYYQMFHIQANRCLKKLCLSQKGFSLIEMIAVVTIVGLIIPTTTSILITLLRHQARIYSFTQVKREGDYLFNYLKTYLGTETAGVYNSNTLLLEMCTGIDSSYGPIVSSGDSTPFYFSNRTGAEFHFYVDPQNNMFYQKNIQKNKIPLSTTKVRITQFTLYCYKMASLARPIIGFSYTVEYNSQPQIGTKPTALFYQGRLRLK